MGKLKIFITAILLFAPITCLSSTYYISPDGDDSYSGVTSTCPVKTFHVAFVHRMSGGDELILLDGTYSLAAGTGFITFNDNEDADTNCGQPPNGLSLSTMTTIKGKTSGGATVIGVASGDFPQALFLGRSTAKAYYINVEDIDFRGGGQLYNADYCTVKNCGFFNDFNTNVGAFGIGAGNHTQGNRFNLIEDCWFWGAHQRVLVGNYRADCNVWRRNVIRDSGGSDSWRTGGGNPCVGFTVYESTGVSVQNMIIVDRALNGGSPYADFASAQHTAGYPQSSNEWLGCMSINSDDSGFSLDADSAAENTLKLTNCVAWDDAVNGVNTGGAANDPVLSNITIGQSGVTGMRVQSSKGPITGGAIANIISYNSGTYGFNVVIQPTYCTVYGSVTSAYYSGGQECKVGARTTDPTSDGTPASLKYPVRIEDGSALKGTGAGGADYGANVMYRYGTDGTRYGEPGYNTLTTNKLWPWPNEALIKADMAIDGARGFCTGNSLDGTPQTLTKYIWEYIGNQIPSSIYGITTTTLRGPLTLSGQGVVH